MATYKLIQDIEAEDKILGPLTLRQFIFAMIAVFLFYLCFVVIVKHVVFLLALFLPPALFFGFFALPFGRDQPTEVWFLAKLRFWFKPRRRVWSQSGIKELVTITVPKKVERVLTKGLSQTEVKSRLQMLAQTLDSRGWAVKHVASDAYGPLLTNNASDRLIDFDNLPQEVPGGEVGAADDMLDETSNPIARQFDTMINQSSRARRQELISQLNDSGGATGTGLVSSKTTDNPWFMSQARGSVSASDSLLSSQLAARAGSSQVSFGNLRTFRPAATPAADQAVPAAPPVPMTAPDDPAILSLARNDDLNVATLARAAEKNRPDKNRSSDEVVVSLH